MEKSSVVGFLVVALFVTVSHALGKREPAVLHGSSYRIKNVGDQTYLQASRQAYIPGQGIKPGKVYQRFQAKDDGTQLWDAIVLGRDENNSSYIWMVPKTYALNALTIYPIKDSPKVDKNIVEFFYTSTQHGQGHMMRSRHFGKCLESNGEEDLYADCNPTNIFQMWEFHSIYDDELQHESDLTDAD